MSGRGRGRGRGRGGGRTIQSYTFDIKALIGDDASAFNFDREPKQPPPLYPPLSKVPLPVKVNALEEYRSTIRQEAIERCRSNLYINPLTKQSIERYRERYKFGDPGRACEFDKRILANGFLANKRHRSKSTKKDVRMETSSKKGELILEKLDVEDEDETAERETKDETVKEADADKDDKESDEDNDLVVDEEEEEEEAEQITDYISSYFDNGEEYLDDDDDKFDDSLAW